MRGGDQDRFEVLWPLAPSAPDASGDEVAPRSPELAGRKIGLLWDYLFRGDEIFDAVKAEMATLHPDVEFVDFNEFGNIHGHDEADVIEALPIVLRRTGVDSVIAAVGA